MAMQDNSKKSVFIILGIGLVAVLFVVITALLANRQPQVSQSAFQDDLSRLIFNTPTEWTTGRSESSKVQINSQFVQTIRQQSSQCSATGTNVSQSLRSAMQGSRAGAVAAFKTMYPGLVDADLYSSSGGFRVMAGIDTCDTVLVRKNMYFRGIVYKDNIELQFTMRYPQSADLSQAQLNDLARSIMRGQNNEYQFDWQQLISLLTSIRE